MLKINRIFLLILSLTVIGCTSTKISNNENTEKVITKALLPVSLAAAYFGSLATHEGGHALAGYAFGADKISINMFPDFKKMELGDTTISSNKTPSSLEMSFFNTSGVTASFAGHVLTRELLKTGIVPNVLQPSLQWYSLSCEMGLYGECLWGLLKLKGKDLAKEPGWITLVFLDCAIIYDLVDICLLDNPARYFKVLVGEEFYKTTKSHFSAGIVPAKGGGSALIGFNW